MNEEDLQKYKEWRYKRMAVESYNVEIAKNPNYVPTPAQQEALSDPPPDNYLAYDANFMRE
jgi:hypothetical protein